MAKTSSFAAKDRIHHFVYGSGTITEMNDRHTTILFDEAGQKKFLTSLVKLERSDSPAPAKRPRKTVARKASAKSTTTKTAADKKAPAKAAKKTTKKSTKKIAKKKASRG